MHRDDKNNTTEILKTIAGQNYYQRNPFPKRIRLVLYIDLRPGQAVKIGNAPV